MKTSDANEAKTNEAAVATERSGGCCGGPAKERSDACCAQDEEAKDAGGEGCGCEAEPTKAQGCCG